MTQNRATDQRDRTAKSVAPQRSFRLDDHSLENNTADNRLPYAQIREGGDVCDSSSDSLSGLDIDRIEMDKR